MGVHAGDRRLRHRGDSSLARLKHMPVDVPKTTRCSSRHVGDDRDRRDGPRHRAGPEPGHGAAAEGIETYGEYVVPPGDDLRRSARSPTSPTRSQRRSGADRRRRPVRNSVAGLEGQALRAFRRKCSSENALGQRVIPTAAVEAVPEGVSTTMSVQDAAKPSDAAMTPRDFRFKAGGAIALVEQIPGVVYLDPVNESLDSIFVSPQVRELLGIEPEDWIADQSCWSKHVHPDDFMRVWHDYTSAYANDVPMSHEYRMVHEDGTVKWVLELARPIHDEHGVRVIQDDFYITRPGRRPRSCALARNEAPGGRSSRRNETLQPPNWTSTWSCARSASAPKSSPMPRPRPSWILTGRNCTPGRDRVPRRQGQLLAARGYTARLDASAQPIRYSSITRSIRTPSGPPGQGDGNALGCRRSAPSKARRRSVS